MVKSNAETVDAYLEELPSERREMLSQLRQLVLEEVPDVEERMDYGMPTYGYKDGILCATASQKQYVSLYVEPEMLDPHRDAFGHLDIGKSCIRFGKLEDLPIDEVRRVLRKTADRLAAAHEAP